MEIKNEKLSRIQECYSDELHIEKSKLRCVIESSTMEDSLFKGVNLSGSVFRQGELRGSDFEQMGMGNCTFRRTSMTRPNFTNVGMSGAIFKSSDMDRSDFDGVGLVGGIITKSDLTNFTIRNCKMEGMTIDGYNVRELIEFYKNNYKGE